MIFYYQNNVKTFSVIQPFENIVLAVVVPTTWCN